MHIRLIIGALALGSALALSGGVASAAPPSFSFNLDLGGGGPPPMGPPPGGFHLHDDEDECLSPKRIMRQLMRMGYEDFEMVDRSRHSFIVDARHGFRWYELEVDNCTGEVLDRERIHR